MPLLVGGVLVIFAARVYLVNQVPLILTALILATITWHLIDFERGRNQTGTDFGVTVAGYMYLGWLGAYFVDLRFLEEGVWWFFLVLGSVWLADSFAYFIGSGFGKHLLCPRLSPKKTWEGYWGGVVLGTLGTVGLTYLFTALGGPALPWWKAVILGGVLSLLTTLGDLGESMLKRFAGVKDSGSIMPGHGGFLDRIDSWLWGVAIGYYLITWML